MLLLLLLITFQASQLSAQCLVSGTHYTANYNSGWLPYDFEPTPAPITNCYSGGNGAITYSGNQCTFVTARCAKELRITSSIPVLSDDHWTMDFKLAMNNVTGGALATNSSAIGLAVLSSANLNLVTSCTGLSLCTSCGSYPNTNMDAIYLSLSSDEPNNCTDSKAMRFIAYSREGNSAPTPSTGINLISGTSTYYLRLQRTDKALGLLSVFSDASYSTHIPGSPVCFSIPTTVSNLRFLSHEVHAQGACGRVFNGTISNLKIDNNLTCPLSLTPSFTANSPICETGQIIVDGTASSGSPLPITSHIWSVQECNSAGVPVTGSAIWWSPWFSGNPFIYNIPGNLSGPQLQCGKYYSVKLSVSNCGNSWASTNRVVFIRCRPVFDLRSTPTILCSNGGTFFLNVNFTPPGGPGPSNYSISVRQLNPGAGIIYSSAISGSISIPIVYPQLLSPITYRVLIRDNVTGCTYQIDWVISPGACPRLSSKDELDVKLSPNPAGNFVSLSSNVTEDLKVEIFNLNGELLLNQNNVTAETQLNVTALPDGIYIVKIWLGNEVKIEKLTVTKN